MIGCGAPIPQDGSTSAGDIFIPPLELCFPGPNVAPDVATDGQRVYLEGTIPANARVFLTGYRYNNAPPSRSQRFGDGREAMFCGCTNVLLQDAGSEFGPLPFFVVPDGAPSGDYSVQVLPAGASCPSTCAPTNVCAGLQVAPSYILSTTERFKFNENSENDSDSPAEMAFVFASSAGTAFGDGETLVKWTGAFPGGQQESAHLTNADGSTLTAHVPLFVGRESLMTVGECREECAALPSSRVSACLQACQQNDALGRFNDHLDIGVAGVEYDESPSKAYGVIAGIVAGAASCYLAVKFHIPKLGCTVGAGSVGVYVADAVNGALADEDDHLGSIDVTHTGGVLGQNWNVGNDVIGPRKLAGPTKNGGDVDLFYRNRRVAAPRILGYKVSVNSIAVDQGLDCERENDVFLQARAMLHDGRQELVSTTRFPEGEPENWKINEGSTKTFSPPLVIAQESFAAESAPESPFLYVEIAPWEHDDNDANDSFGIEAETIPTGDLVGITGNSVDGISSEGFFTRTKTVTIHKAVNGWQAADTCGSGAGGVDVHRPKGRVRLEYQVEMTWLRQIRRQ
jgi:hypothetical protein